MRGEAEELGIFEEPAAPGAMIRDDDTLHLIEEDLLRGTPPNICEGALETEHYRVSAVWRGTMSRKSRRE